MVSRLLLLFLFLQSALYAQTTLTGMITDAKGVPIPGANVYLEDSYDGASSGQNGNFRFTTTLSGPQILTVSAIGFHTLHREVRCEGGELQFTLVLKEAINKLTAVTITAGSMEASDEKRSVVFKPLDILTTSGALGDVVGALSTLPGTSTIGNDGRLFVRGGDASETAIFFDGLRVGNAYGTSTSGVPTRTRFNPVLFKGTFFSTGGYSAEYGQALSSALVLNTIDMPVRDQTDISLMTVGGGVSHTQAGDTHSGTASINYVDLAPYQAVVPQDFDWERAPSALSGEFQYRYKISKKGMLKAFYSHQRAGLDLWQKIPGSDSRGQRVDISNIYHFANLSFKQALSARWLLEGGSSLSVNRDALQIDSLKLERGEDLAHFKLKSTYFHNDRLSLVSGAEHFAEGYREAQPQLERERTLKAPLSALFTEASYYLSSEWMVRAGLRGENDALASAWYTSPRLSVAYQFNPRSQFSAAYGIFNQAASHTVRLSHPDLNHTRATHYIFNYLFAKDGYTLRAEVFYKDYEDLVTQPQEETFANGGYGTAKGFDVFYRDRKSFRNTDYWITYSFVHSLRKSGRWSEAIQPGFAPRHNVSVVAKHFVSSLKSQIGGSWSWNDGLAYDNPNKAGIQESRTKPFSNLSLSLSYLHRPNVILHAAVTNVLGRDNIFGYNYASTPDANGQFASLPRGQGAKRFFFLGLFITLSSDKKANQLNNL